MNSAWLLPLAVLVANVSALAISLLVPLVLPVEQYSIFALCWSAGQLLAGVGYEWMRIGVLRYSVGSDEALAATRRDLLWLGFALVTLLMILLAITSALFAGAIPMASSVAAVFLYGACQGVFEGKQARARAQQRNLYYSISWMMRTFVSLAFGLLAAWLTGSGTAAIWGIALSFPVTMLILKGWDSTRIPKFKWDREQVLFLARYGVFAAFATIASLLLPACLRLLAVGSLDLEAAGGMLLAADLSQKAISIVALAANIVLVQGSNRVAEFGSDSELTTRIRLQLAATAAFILPTAIGFLFVQNEFVTLFISEGYRATYWEAITPICVASGILAMRMFAIDSLFSTIGKTTGAIVGPLISIGTTVVIISVTSSLTTLTPSIFGYAYMLSVFIGALASILMLAKTRPVSWPLDEFTKIVVACMPLSLVLYIPSQESAWYDLVAKVAVGGVTYSTAAFVLNVCNIRALVSRRRR